MLRYFQRLHHSSISSLVLQARGGKWVIINQVTRVMQSSNVVHHSTTAPSTYFPARPPIVKFIWGDERLMIYAMHQFLLCLILFKKILTSLLLFIKVHQLANPHIPLLTLFPMIAYLLHFRSLIFFQDSFSVPKVWRRFCIILDGQMQCLRKYMH